MFSRYIAIIVLLLIVVAIGITAVANVLITRFSDIEKEKVPIGVSDKDKAATPVKVNISIIDGVILLPYPMIRKNVLSTEEAIAFRRSVREYQNMPISIEQLSQLLWATYGVSETRHGLKTTPSAGATYPLEMYIVVGEEKVTLPDASALQAGVYKYDPYTHSLRLVRAGNFMEELSKAAVNQRWVKEAAVNIVICAAYERTTRVYGERGYRYVYMEVGHAGQNIYLEATALNLGAVVIGAFHDDWVKSIVNADENEHPLYIVSVGVPREIYRISEDEIAKYIDSRRREKGLVQ
ncbi:MAG: SagB/ThcOx family dehydrogenase [Ignisphaera sp.]